MNINVRIRQYRQRQAERVNVPGWKELNKLDEEQVKQLAEKVGITYEGRMETLSAINKTRG